MHGPRAFTRRGGGLAGRGKVMCPETADKVLNMPDTALVCFCAGVSKGQIREAVNRGCHTLPALRAATGCCPPDSDCEHNNPEHRCCMTDISALLAHFLSAGA